MLTQAERARLVALIGEYGAAAAEYERAVVLGQRPILTDKLLPAFDAITDYLDSITEA